MQEAQLQITFGTSFFFFFFFVGLDIIKVMYFFLAFVISPCVQC